MLLGKPLLAKRAREAEARQRSLIHGQQADAGAFSSPIVADGFDEQKAADPFGDSPLAEHAHQADDGHGAHEAHDFSDEVRKQYQSDKGKGKGKREREPAWPGRQLKQSEVQ